MIHISQIYPCSRIRYNSELFYVIELAKYLKEDYNETLSLDGVLLHKHFNAKNPMYNYLIVAVDNGWVDMGGKVLGSFNKDIDGYVNIKYTLSDETNNDINKRLTDKEYNKRTPRLTKLNLIKCTPELWSWITPFAGEGTGTPFYNTMKSISDGNSELRVLSMIAFAVITKFKTGHPEAFYIVPTNELTTIKQDAFIPYLFLEERCNCFMGMVKFSWYSDVSQAFRNNQDYVSWLSYRAELGGNYSLLDSGVKYKKCVTDGVKVGDIVALYTRDNSTPSAVRKDIISCKFAKILRLTPTVVEFDCFNTTKTKYQLFSEFDERDDRVKEMYDGQDVTKFNTNTLNIAWYELGYNHTVTSEEYFFATLDQCNDVTFLVVTDNTRVDRFNLPQNEAVYWLLKDHGYRFDEARFIEKYLNNGVPLYTQYMNGAELDDCYKA